MKGWRLATFTALGAILALGVVLRVYHLGDRPIWFDEAFSYTLVERFTWPEMVERTALDVHPPFYYAVLRCWTACLGTSPVAMRSLSVVLAGTTMGAFYLVCRDTYSPWREQSHESRLRLAQNAGLIAALLIAVSAVHIRWSYEARMYTLGTTLLGLSTWALVRALRPSNRAPLWWTCYSLSAAALLYTHNYALFSVAAQWLFLAGYFSYQRCGWLATFADRRFRQAAMAVAFAALLYAPWVPVLRAQKARVQADYWIPAVSAWSVPEAWLSLLVPANSARAGTNMEALAVAAALVCALALFVWLGGTGRWLVTCMVVCPVALALAISMVSVSIVVGRHFLFAYMFVLCAVARLVASLPGAERAIVLGLLVMNSGAALARYHGLLRTETAPGIRGAMEHVLARRQPEEPIVVLHPCIYFSARYYAGDKAPAHLYLGGQQPTHYAGAPILRETDCWNEADLNQARTQRIWALDTTGFGAGFQHGSLPPQWRPAGQAKVFRALFFFEGEVSVGMYERSREDDAQLVEAQP